MNKATRKLTHNGPKAARGSTLMESLISLVILSLGSLGVAGMQITSKQSTFESMQRTRAAYFANDVIERIRTNPTGLAVYSGKVVGGGTIATKPSPACGTGAPCSPAQLAAYDLWEWEQAIDGAAAKSSNGNSSGLLAPTGCITNVNGQVNVAISWYGMKRMSDGAGAATSSCGTAGSNRRQLVVATFVAT